MLALLTHTQAYYVAYSTCMPPTLMTDDSNHMSQCVWFAGTLVTSLQTLNMCHGSIDI